MSLQTATRPIGRSAGGGVALVTEIIAPYRIPLFNEVARLLDGALDVIFIAETQRRRDWPVYADEIEFRHHVLGGIQLSVPYHYDRLPVYLSRPLLPRLVRKRYDVIVVGGWSHLECYQALAYARLTKHPFVLWSETPLLEPQLPPRRLRNAVKRMVVGEASAFVVPGPSAARYLEALGAPPSRIHIAPNSVDEAFWSVVPQEARHPARTTLLFVGRLVETKGLALALEAFGSSRLAAEAELVVVGDGPDRARLEAVAPASVRFLGNCKREELRTLYHSADALVVPSLLDAWGVVVNEAACAGVPVIATDGVGAARDHVVDGVNGMLVPRGSVEALRIAFDRVADDPGLLRRLRPGAAAIATACSTAVAARGLVEAIESVGAPS